LLPQDEFMPVYAAHLRGIIKKGVDDKEDYEHPLRGFHIVVDAGNGGGGYFAYDVLQPLGANIEGRLL
jgi:phosphomannomutase